MQTASIIRSFRRAGLSIIFGAVASSASIAAADQTFPIKLHLARGDKWSFDATTAMSEKGQILANGQVAQPIDQAFQQRRKGTIEVVEIENGAPTEMKITYDAESSNGGGQGAQQPPPFKLAGRTVHVSRKNGILTTDLGNDIDTPTIQEVGHMLDPDLSIYPKEAVAVNQEWDGDTAASAKAYQLGPDDKITIKCKLLEVKNIGGRQVAEIGLNGTMLKHDQGFIETRIKLEGTSRVDLQTGQAVDSSMSGKINMTGTQQQPGPDGRPVKIDVSADGDITVRQSVKLLNGAGGNDVPVAGPGFGGGFAAGGNPPEGRPPMRGNGPFSGNFKGEGVALELSDNAGQISGTLTVGEKKYPIAAKSDGTKLTGNFDSDGSKFDFTASLDGTTLTLNSEGNTYTLKKPANNPLARPDAKNPLAQPAAKNPLAN